MNHPHDPQEPLRDDVRMLGEMLGNVLKDRGGAQLFGTVERVRGLSKGGRSGDPDAADRLAELLRALPVGSAVPVARAFAHFLTLANIAEQHQRVRRRRDYMRRPGGVPQPASFDEVLPRLIDGGVNPDSLYEAVVSTRIELVLTAHPTAITRRTLVYKHRRIAELLAYQDRTDLTLPERAEIDRSLAREVMAIWQTDEVRSDQPTPLDEVTSGLLIFEQSLWDAVPAYLRALDAALHRATNRHLPLDVVPVRFGSWIGGDRDGNPYVTPDVTRRACLVARWMAADLYEREIAALGLELSMTQATPELRSVTNDAREPYRALLRNLRARLRDTRSRLGRMLAAKPEAVDGGGELVSSVDLRKHLNLCYRSLVDTGQALIAEGRLTDTIRRVEAFGATLVRLDLRQHVQRHTAALDALTRALGEGSYADWNEAQRQAFLVSGLGRRPSSVAASLPSVLDDEVRDVLDTFRVAATIPADSLGVYVVSMAHAPSDVLAVEYLQSRAGGSRLPVVPLFEQIEDLRGAAGTLRALLAIPEYRGLIAGQQQVMIGYSDSAKDGGRLAANWELYRAQEAIVAVCGEASVELTLFHGRGGSISRGGGPTYLAIGSQPPGSVDGRLRVTEQGEMIQAQFGLEDIAVRTLEVYTTATLNATLNPPPPPRSDWREAMDRLAETARAAYRQTIYEDPRFIEYFRLATPEAELGLVPIGSRPARRSADADVQSLRAIPWVFAWTQTRLLLPSWLGTSEALTAALGRGDRAVLHDMYDAWPFFRSTVELIETTLAEADPRIAAEYDRRLVPQTLQPIGDDLRRRFSEAVTAVLRITRRSELLEGNPVLKRSIAVRNPYVDPINLVQIELLRRLRTPGPVDPDLHKAFIITVNGIAAGMRNTG